MFMELSLYIKICLIIIRNFMRNKYKHIFLNKKYTFLFLIYLNFNINLKLIESSSPSALKSWNSREKNINDLSSISNRNYKETIQFLHKIDGFDPKKLCPSLIRSDFLAKINRFKSIISTCPGPGFCKLAIRSDGTIYATSDSRLETILNITQISKQDLAGDASLFGAHYIKFVYAGKYLCIDHQNKLIALTTQNKECLWFTNNRPISSAGNNRKIKLIIQNNQLGCRIRANFPNNLRKYEKSQILDDNKIEHCIKVENAYSADIYRLKSNCIRLINNGNHSSNGKSLSLFKSKTEPPIIKKTQLSTTFSMNNTNKNIVYSTKITTKNNSFSNSKSSFMSRPISNKTSSKELNELSKKFIINNPNKLRNNIAMKFQKYNKKFIKIDHFHNMINIKNKNNNIKPSLIFSERVKKICNKYLQEELIYKKMNNIEYLYEIKFGSREVSLAKAPKLCIHYYASINPIEYSDNGIDINIKSITSTNHIFLNNTINNKILNDHSQNNFNSIEKISLTTKVSTITNKYKICFSYRKTSAYKECMKKNYKCYQFNNDLENLKKCRKKFGIKVPNKKINSF